LLFRTVLWSRPLAGAHEAVALYEMQMLCSRLTPAIFISLGNAVARRCNLSRVFRFHRLGICGRGSERDCCASPNRHTQEQRPHHRFLTFVHSRGCAQSLRPLGLAWSRSSHRNQQRPLLASIRRFRARQSAACCRHSLTARLAKGVHSFSEISLAYRGSIGNSFSVCVSCLLRIVLTVC